MLAMREIDCVAPFDAASMMFLSCLKNIVILDNQLFAYGHTIGICHHKQRNHSAIY